METAAVTLRPRAKPAEPGGSIAKHRPRLSQGRPLGPSYLYYPSNTQSGGIRGPLHVAMTWRCSRRRAGLPLQCFTLSFQLCLHPRVLRNGHNHISSISASASVKWDESCNPYPRAVVRIKGTMVTPVKERGGSRGRWPHHGHRCYHSCRLPHRML